MYSLTQLNEIYNPLRQPVLSTDWDWAITLKCKPRINKSDCEKAERILRNRLTDIIFGRAARKRNQIGMNVNKPLIEMVSIIAKGPLANTRHFHGFINMPIKFQSDRPHLSRLECLKEFKSLIRSEWSKLEQSVDAIIKPVSCKVGWMNYMLLNLRDGHISQV